MRQLARHIPVLVALLVLVVVAVLVARGRTARDESVGPPPSRADVSLKDVDVEEESGGVRWRLVADQALVFEDEARTALKNVRVRVDEPGRSWTIVGEEGEVDRRSKDLEVRRNVVVTASDGLRLETSVLHWESADQRLWTDAPVTLTRGGAVVQGHGLEVKVAQEATTVRGPVHARFVEGAAR